MGGWRGEKSAGGTSDGENGWRVGGWRRGGTNGPKTQLAADTQGQRDGKSERQTEREKDRERERGREREREDDKNRGGEGKREQERRLVIATDERWREGEREGGREGYFPVMPFASVRPPWQTHTHTHTHTHTLHIQTNTGAAAVHVNELSMEQWRLFTLMNINEGTKIEG